MSRLNLKKEFNISDDADLRRLQSKKMEGTEKCVFLIGVIYTKSKGFTDDDIAFYRILDMKSYMLGKKGNKVTYLMDLSHEQLKKALSNKKQSQYVSGVDLVGGKIVANNGVFKRYPAIVGGPLVKGFQEGGKEIVVGLGDKVVDTPTYTVIKMVDDNKYVIADWKGKVYLREKEDVIKLAEKVGLSNSKLVNRNGIKYISHINGEIYRDYSMFKSKEDSSNIYEGEKKGRDVTNLIGRHDLNKIKEGKAKDGENVLNIKEEDRVLKIDGIGLTGIRRDRYITGDNKFRTRSQEVCPSTGLTVEQKMSAVYERVRYIKPFLYSVLFSVPRIETTELPIPTMAVSADKFYYHPDCVLENKVSELIFIVIHEILHITFSHVARGKGLEPDIFNIAADLYVNKLIADDFGLQRPGDYRDLELDSSILNMKVRIKIPEWVCFNEEVDTTKETMETIYNELMSSRVPQNKGNGDGKDSSQDSSKGDSQEGNQGGKKGGTQDGSQRGTQGGAQGGKKYDYYYKGKKVYSDGDEGIDRLKDLFNDPNSEKGTPEQIKRRARDIINRAKTINKLIGKNRGVKGGSDLLERKIEEAFAPRIDWKSILKKHLIRASEKDSSLMSPDRRFVGRGLHLPGLREQEPDTLGEVKICIDTSGSISDDELSVAYKHVKNLLKAYKAEGQVIFWNTEIEDSGRFDDFESFKSLRPKKSGGTTPEVIFEEFSKREYKNGKKRKPGVILIFTDGYFTGEYESYKKEFNRNTYWILTNDCYEGFKPKFGKKCPMKFE